jgi:hypothetical protein
MIVRILYWNSDNTEAMVKWSTGQTIWLYRGNVAYQLSVQVKPPEWPVESWRKCKSGYEITLTGNVHPIVEDEKPDAYVTPSWMPCLCRQIL